MIRALLLLVLFSTSSFAAIDTHNFKSVEDEKRFHALAAELRCPKCQNQNIADSDSPIAKDLRTEVFRMIDEGAVVSQPYRKRLISCVKSSNCNPLTQKVGICWLAR